MAEFIRGLGMYRVGPGEVGYGPGVRTTTGFGMTGQTVDYSISKPVPIPGTPQPPPQELLDVYRPPAPSPFGGGRIIELPPAPAPEQPPAFLPQAPAAEALPPLPLPVGAAGPPWTQLDMEVDANGSTSAAAAIAMSGIHGQSIVRGHFNGRFRGFVQGL